MKRTNGIRTSVFTMGIVLLLVSALVSGCVPFLGKPKEADAPSGETGLLSISLTGAETASQSGAALAARTMVALDPEFTRYELYVSPNPETNTGTKTYSSITGSFQITLPARQYTISAAGFSGDNLTAKTWDMATRTDSTETVTISGGISAIASLKLNPYMDTYTYGALHYSLTWEDTVRQIPARATMLVERFISGETWTPIPISLIREPITADSSRGTILLVQTATGLVQKSGVLPLPPGEYRLTTTVTMDGPNPPVSRVDIAHVFSNLATPAAFFYGSGDLIVTNSGANYGVSYIESFTFSETPTAVSIIGSNPGPDGTRTIMVMVPAATNLASLTPVVKCFEGAYISSPPPIPGVTDSDGNPAWGSGDYSQPTFWTAMGRNGVSQQYTVIVTKAESDDCLITDIAFENVGMVQPPIIDHNASPNATIKIILPSGAPENLNLVFSYYGSKVELVNLDTTTSPVPATITKTVLTTGQKFRVTANNNSTTKDYTVTAFVLPPALSTDTGIFDFVITNVLKAKVVIGTKPRADGKIPIVVQVPYSATPLISTTPPKIDLQNLIPAIKLSGAGSTLSVFDGSYISLTLNANGTIATSSREKIPFGNQDDYQEAIYRVTAPAGNTQDYVVVVARDVQYYYVKANGSDTDPDLYNGSTESKPFRTLAYAVSNAVEHNVDHIFIIGTLDNTSEGGAYEDTHATNTGDGGTFHSSGGASLNTGSGLSVFNLNGTGRSGSAPYPIYISGLGSNAALDGTGSGKRVISITGGAHITFENLTVQGGGGDSYAGNGGGIYVGGGSTVVWKSGGITGSTARSGGGVFLDGSDSEFEFMGGVISGNTATGTTGSNFTTGNSPNIQGGGGVYVMGDALFWLAEGQISGNTALGSGGGVLVNGSAVPDAPTDSTLPRNFIMSSGTVNGNIARGSVWPHGGGGVYVAKGVFTMLNGQIINNTATRQGGGVFIWSRAIFYMDGNSSVTANNGLGSAKAICSRGVTQIRGNAQADKVYIWNYANGSWNYGAGDEFTLMEGARIGGIVLAFADDPINNRNYISVAASDRSQFGFGQLFSSGTDLITTIDLESRLTASGSFSTTATIDSDWRNQYLISRGNGSQTIDAATLSRFRLGSFTYGGSAPQNPPYPSSYRLDSYGKLVR